MQNQPDPAALPPAPEPSDTEAYPEWLNKHVRLKLIRRRVELKKTPHSMAIRGKLSAQTIRNIEKGTHSPTLTTLALICGQLDGTQVQQLFPGGADLKGDG